MPGNFWFNWTIIYQVPTQMYMHKDMGWGSWLPAVHNYIRVQMHVLLEVGCTGTKPDKLTRSQRSNIEIRMAVNCFQSFVRKTKTGGAATSSRGLGSPGVTWQELNPGWASLGELKTQSRQKVLLLGTDFETERREKKCSGFALLSLPSLSIPSCWLNPSWNSCTRTWEMEMEPELRPPEQGRARTRSARRVQHWQVMESQCKEVALGAGTGVDRQRKRRTDRGQWCSPVGARLAAQAQTCIGTEWDEITVVWHPLYRFPSWDVAFCRSTL